MYVIYENPQDHPGVFVVRGFTAGADGITPDGFLAIGPTLGAVRAMLPKGLTFIPRHPGDDPVVVEIWV